jgi:hypothetical protein
MLTVTPFEAACALTHSATASVAILVLMIWFQFMLVSVKWFMVIWDEFSQNKYGVSVNKNSSVYDHGSLQ